MATRSDTADQHDRKPAAQKRARGRPARAEGDGKVRRYDAAETRARILEAAYLLFGTRGYSGTGTADIAAQADVSEGSIFYHFGSKNGLLTELGRLHGQKLVAAMQGDEPLGSLTYEISMNRCFDFCEANNLWEETKAEGACSASAEFRKSSPEAEPFYQASREIIVDWTKAHLDALAVERGDPPTDRTLMAQLVFATVGEAMRQYLAPDATDEDRAHIRCECVRFCQTAVGAD